MERAEEPGGQHEAPELEAFVLDHDNGEEDAELLQRELEAHNIEITQPDADAEKEEAAEKQYEAGPVSGAADSLQLFLADVVLEHERLELGSLELATVLFCAFHERLHVLRFKEFHELVLRQRLFQSFRISLFSATNLRSL
jgi:hypothetical protein